MRYTYLLMKSLLVSPLALLILLAPVYSFAQNNTTPGKPNDPGVTVPQQPNDPGVNSGQTTTYTPPANSSGNTTNSTQITEFPLQVKLKNPLKVSTVQDAIKLFMDAVVKIAIPFIVVFFIWAGLSFILARGNPEGIKKARAMFWNTVIGTLLILGAWVITDAIVGTINSIAS